jgi:hypothetical protein
MTTELDEALALPLPVGYVIRMAGNYHTGGFCAEISCDRILDPQTKLYAIPPPTAALIAEREAQLFEARQAIIKEGLARDAAEKRVGELEEKLMVLLAIQRKILASETAPASPAPATAVPGQ